MINITIPSLDELERQPISNTEAASGIYFLFCNNDLYYIGQTVDIQKRFKQHIRQNTWFKSITHYSLFTTKKHCVDRELIEGIYIFTYKPFYNRHISVYVNTPIKQLEKQPETEPDWETVHKSYREHHPAFTEGW